MTNKKFIPVQDLEIYKLARELSKTGWKIYDQLNWQDKKTTGDQFIRATDSFGANFVEGYARYHFLDKIKFCYNARGSLSEASDYWIELLKERNKVNQENYNQFKETANKSSIKLQNFITATYRSKNNNKFQ
ncbi:MAG: four helix bundle protein [Candidatus Moranbacteria bacterium]|nr:four helix bundle protein [Candidatus Moranbacteria bacterium]